MLYLMTTCLLEGKAMPRCASFFIDLQIGGCLSLIIKVFFLVQGKTLSDNFEYIWALIALTCFGIVNWFYSKDDRSLKVYEAYKARHKVMSKAMTIVVGVLLVAIPFFILGFI